MLGHKAVPTGSFRDHSEGVGGVTLFVDVVTEPPATLLLSDEEEDMRQIQWEEEKERRRGGKGEQGRSEGRKRRAGRVGRVGREGESLNARQQCENCLVPTRSMQFIWHSEK